MSAGKKKTAKTTKASKTKKGGNKKTQEKNKK